MKVISTKYPNPSVYLDGKMWQFNNSTCEIPEDLAIKLSSMNPDYQIDRGTLKEGSLSFNPSTWQKDYKKIIWDAPVGFNNGYGKASMMLAEAMGDKVDTYAIASDWLGSRYEYVPDKLRTLLDKRAGNIDSFYVIFFPAWEFTRRVAQRTIGYTMLEATRIPQSWVDNCNNYCERVIVPCEQQRQAFIDSGVKVDVKSIPLGLTPSLFPERDYIDDDNFVFGTMGTLTYRKGTDLLVKAYKKLFPRDKYPNVYLSIKTLSTAGVLKLWFMSEEDLTDNRIILNVESFSPEELVKNFFHTLDCFVFPTRGEGFGLPPLEAMMTGLPVIGTGFSGMSEFMVEGVSLPLDYKLEDMPRGDWRGYPPELQAEGQQWAEPNFDDLCDKMKYAYDNRDKMKAMGKKARKFALKNFTADLAAERVIQYLNDKF